MAFNDRLRSKNKGGSMAGDQMKMNQSKMISALKGGRPNNWRTHTNFTWVDEYPAPGASGEIAALGTAKQVPHDPWMYNYGGNKKAKK